MAIANSACVRGAVAGLAVGIGVVAVAWSGVFNTGPAILQFLVAVPPFLLGGLATAPAPVQALVVVWWGVAGAIIGWGFGLKGSRKTLAILISAALIFGHFHTQAAIERDLSAVANAMAGLLRALFGI